MKVDRRHWSLMSPTTTVHHVTTTEPEDVTAQWEERQVRLRMDEDETQRCGEDDENQYQQLQQYR